MKLGLSILASGLTLIFSMMGVLNFAHASFYMLGAYLALTLTQVTGDVFLATALGIPLAVAFGAAIEWAFVRHLYAHGAWLVWPAMPGGCLAPPATWPEATRAP